MAGKEEAIRSAAAAAAETGPKQQPADFGDVVFTRRWRLGVRALTLVACAYTAGACLVGDWEHKFGPDHVFAGVRPALKSFLNTVYNSGGSSSSSSEGDSISSSIDGSRRTGGA